MRQRFIGTRPDLRAAEQAQDRASGELEAVSAEQLQAGADVNVVVGDEQLARPAIVGDWSDARQNGRPDYV